MFKVSGIYTAREFYGVRADQAGIMEPQFLSTLFWKPGILLDKNGEAGFSFFTGDITGPFKIILQGIGGQDLMIYGETEITVK